jgi:hypothetical protein
MEPKLIYVESKKSVKVVFCMYNSCNNVKRKIREGGFMYGTTHKPTFKHLYGNLIHASHSSSVHPKIVLSDEVSIRTCIHIGARTHCISFYALLSRVGAPPHE